jgi:UDP-4-amino-4,6-dideoxy-N-acetyl-beta-L-altrosamine transaminase
MIPYARQDISEADIQAVVEVLRSNWLTQGPAVPRFEKAVADYCGAAQAVAVCNATATLHLACLALGLGRGDVLWTSPNTFVASANCALYCGAAVDFVDIDPRTYNMSVAALRDKLARAERDGGLPKIVVPVHYAGQSCEMREIAELARRYGFRIIEDASHAVGGSYLGERVGNCRYSDITVFSFHPVKIITTTEGGMAVTNSAGLADNIRLLRSHGVTRDPAQMTGPSQGGWYYEQVALGYNFRMTDMAAALGTSQMARIDRFIALRRAIAARYDEAFRVETVGTPWQHPETSSSYHLYPLRIPGEGRRKSVFDRCRAAGILVNVHYIPVHTQPHYRRLGFKPGDFPEAERFYHEALSLPMFPALTDAQQAEVVDKVHESLR